MPREITKEDFQALFKLYGDKAVKRFNMSGKHPPQLYGVKLGKEPGAIEKTFALNRLAPLFFGEGPFNKDQFAILLKELTTPGSLIRKAAVSFGLALPDVVVQINETWWVTETKPEGTSHKEMLERSRKRNESLEFHPDRKEGVAVFMHAYEYSTMGNCPILDKPKRHAEMGELFDGKMVGRLSMTLDDEDATT